MLFLVSCEKIITVDLNESDSRYVIEGCINNHPGPYQVYISATRPSDSDQPVLIPGAMVIISDDYGQCDTLTDMGSGVYQTGTLQGIVGHRYRLEVFLDGMVFTSESVMGNVVPIDTITTATISGIQQQLLVPVVSFSDPAGQINYYRYVLYVNGIRSAELFLGKDEHSDGLSVNKMLRQGVSSGDSLEVELQNIDEAVFEYFNDLAGLQGQVLAGLTPSNPVSNISGGALGYFSAYAYSRKAVKVN